MLAGLRRLVVLSPVPLAFFYASSLSHALFKSLLGLHQVLNGQYAMRSLVAPPQSLLLAGQDVALCYGAAMALNLARPGSRVQRWTSRVALLALLPFLAANFILHATVGQFLSAGLIAFNGAGPRELWHYVAAGASPVALLFMVTAGSILATTAIADERALPRAMARRAGAAVIIGIVAVPAAFAAASLNAGQSAGLKKTPGDVLVRSLLTRHQLSTRRATADEVARFTMPVAPAFGHYQDEARAATPTPGANVLLVVVESLPYELTPMGGSTDGLTVLGELAARGSNFTNVRSVFPATSRSLLSRHCGAYPTTGPVTVTVTRPDFHCGSVLDTVQRAAYRTGFFTASIFNYDNIQHSSLMRGYQTTEDFFSLRGRARHAGLSAGAVEEELVADRVDAFMRADASRPFFATYWMYWNHAPYELPDDDISSLPPRERYQRCLAYLDGVLRGLLGRAARAGLLDRTIVVVTADHGEAFGDRHAVLNHMGDIYEENVHVPLVIVGPGVPTGSSARQGSTIDLAPTLAHLLALPGDPSWEGQSLFSDQWHNTPTLLFGRAAAITNGVVDGHLKFIEDVATGSRHLFDLSQDPTEQRDLAPEQPQVVETYQSLVGRWLPVEEAHAWAQTP